MSEKQIVKDFEKGKSVDTQELSRAIMEDVKTPKKKVSLYTATAPFSLDGEFYKTGDEVALPGWKRDTTYDAARGEATFAGDELHGLTFFKEGPVIDKSTGERNLYRVTLPVKEQ